MRKRFWIMVSLTAAFGAYWVYDATRLVQGLRFFGSFSMAGSTGLDFLTPIVAGVIAAGSLAADRSRRYPVLILARGVSRRCYLIAKALAMGLASALAISIACTTILVVSALIVPWGISSGSPTSGPFPTLSGTAPFLNDLLYIGLLALAAAALSLVGLLVGAIVSNEHVAAASPLLLICAAILLLKEPFEILSPYTYLDLANTYIYVLPGWLLAFGAVLYWMVFSVVVTMGAGLIFLKREVAY